jgi:hypothetical protein
VKIQDAFREVKSERLFVVRQYAHAKTREAEFKKKGDSSSSDMYWGLKRAFRVSWSRLRRLSVQIGGNCYVYRRASGGSK